MIEREILTYIEPFLRNRCIIRILRSKGSFLVKVECLPCTPEC
jgi:hypothetical protein